MGLRAALQGRQSDDVHELGGAALSLSETQYVLLLDLPPRNDKKKEVFTHEKEKATRNRFR